MATKLGSYPQGVKSGHEGPVHIDQKGPSPGQSVLTKCGPQQDVPYKSGPGVPNKRVD